MFHNFLYKFKTYFKFVRDDNLAISKKHPKYYNWQDRTYSSFMIAFMTCLEPRSYKKDEVLMRDLEEVEEIQFVLKGEVKFDVSII